jgi:hypothetical protein
MIVSNDIVQVAFLDQGWPLAGHRVGALGEALKYCLDLIPFLTHFGPLWASTKAFSQKIELKMIALA